MLAAADRPDLILMDLLMPEMDGLAALAKLRGDPALRGIPVVFLTGRADADDVRRYVEQGALGVIRKPFDPMTLPHELVLLVAAT